MVGNKREDKEDKVEVALTSCSKEQQYLLNHGCYSWAPVFNLKASIPLTL